MNVGDYAQLTESGRISSAYWSERIKQFLANSPRYKIAEVVPWAHSQSGCNYKLNGLDQKFDDAYFEPFKINYGAPCPFEAGDSVRLRNEPNFVPCGGIDKQSVLIAEQGLRSIVIENIDRASPKSLGGLIIWNGIRYADWRRFEYADEPGAPTSVTATVNDKKKPITDHLFKQGEHELSRCVHADEDGICGAVYERHEMLGTGLATRTFAKPQRPAPARHETQLWSPYGEIDNLCRDSE